LAGAPSPGHAARPGPGCAQRRVGVSRRDTGAPPGSAQPSAFLEWGLQKSAFEFCPPAVPSPPRSLPTELSPSPIPLQSLSPGRVPQTPPFLHPSLTIKA
ncbi:hypothetical protein H1C71_032319, partial [Ictidomys tridecemlineatus]